MSGQKLQTEFEFTLPQGYVDDEGNLHREGRMRLATAADEIHPLSSREVRENSSYLTIALLSRVVTELGTIDFVTEDIIEDLFVADLEYLQAMYERINNRGDNAVTTACPECGHEFDVSVETGAVTDASPMDSGPGMEAADVGGSIEAPTDMGGPGMEVPEDHEGGAGSGNQEP